MKAMQVHCDFCGCEMQRPDRPRQDRMLNPAHEEPDLMLAIVENGCVYHLHACQACFDKFVATIHDRKRVADGPNGPISRGLRVYVPPERW